jgi:hypothetical protein
MLDRAGEEREKKQRGKKTVGAHSAGAWTFKVGLVFSGAAGP